MSQLLTLRWISTNLLWGAIFALGLLTACSTAQNAPSAPPVQWVVTGSATTWSAQITMPRGNLSGLCVVRVRHDSIVGAWVNEFGVQAFDFTYERRRQRIRLAHLIPPLRGFFLRRMLKKDFQTFVPHFATGQAFSHQNHHGIRYDFVPLPLDITQTVQDSTSIDTTAP